MQDDDAFELSQIKLRRKGIFRRCGNDPCGAPNSDGEGCERCGLKRPEQIDAERLAEGLPPLSRR
jgi:hypothetical protein